MAAAAASVVAMAALIAVVPTAAIPVLAGRQGVLAARLSNAATAHGVAARPIASASGGTCLGLRESHCVPCPEPEQNDCDRVKRECDNLLCSPLCLDLAWNCTLTVDAGSPLAAAMTASEKAALCAQVVAEACSTEFGCCAKDGALYDWVERFAYQGQYPASLVRARGGAGSECVCELSRVWCRFRRMRSCRWRRACMTHATRRRRTRRATSVRRRWE